MQTKIYTFLIAALLCCTACEQETIASLNTDTPIVEAYLFAGQTLDSLRVTESNSYADSNAQVITLDNLAISLSDGTNVFDLTFIGNGYYQNEELIIEPGKSYEMQFTHQEELVSASTYIPLQKEATISVNSVQIAQITSFPPNITEVDPIEITWDNADGDYFYVVVENMEENPEEINLLFEQNGIDRRQFRFVSQPEITDFYGIDTRREIQQFGTHRIIVYRVNPEYAALYETSGSTSTTIVEPPSNVENGLGIFTGVSSDTLFLEVIKL